MLTETISQVLKNIALKLSACSNDEGYSQWVFAAGWTAIAWYVIVALVCFIGCLSIQRNYSKIPQKSISATTLPPALVPHVTVIRPIKGLEPYLYENLAASLRQEYPRDKLTVCFCVASRDDPAFPVVQKLLADFPDADTRLYIEPEYANHELGPNPKIRNMSRAYYEAKGDLIWIVDCNVWLSKGVCGRMVDNLCGLGPGGQKYKFVHHLPLVVDVDDQKQSTEDEEEAIPSCSRINYAANVESEANKLQRQLQEQLQQPGTLTDRPPPVDQGAAASGIMAKGGGRLEELFLSSAHAKMYSAINTVLIAPCIVGKSSMFRRSHLDYLTAPSKSDSRPYSRRPGVDFFSDNICEDHMIGDRLWKRKIFEEEEYGQKWGKHHLVAGDLAIQPTSKMSVSSYIHRRVRWLRVRKFTVLAATLVEPGTESFLCSLYLAFGLTTSLPHQLFGKDYCSHFLASWTAFALIWMASIFCWINVDWYLYRKLHSATTIEVDEHTPPFARLLNPGTASRRPFREWFLAWVGRESLAFPIWAWSFYGGRTIMWKDRAFKVGLDGVAREVVRKNDAEQRTLPSKNSSKDNGINGTVGDSYYEARGSIRRPRAYINSNSNNNGEGNLDIRRRTPTGSVGKRDTELIHPTA